MGPHLFKSRRIWRASSCQSVVPLFCCPVKAVLSHCGVSWDQDMFREGWAWPHLVNVLDGYWKERKLEPWCNLCTSAGKYHSIALFFVSSHTASDPTLSLSHDFHTSAHAGNGTQGFSLSPFPHPQADELPLNMALFLCVVFLLFLDVLWARSTWGLSQPLCANSRVLLNCWKDVGRCHCYGLQHSSASYQSPN